MHSMHSTILGEEQIQAFWMFWHFLPTILPSFVISGGENLLFMLGYQTFEGRRDR